LNFLLLLFLLIFNLNGADFSKKSTINPLLVQDGDIKYWSPIYGLKIEDYYKTSFIAKLKMSGIDRQYATIRGLIIDMEEYGIDSTSIKALDITTQKYINAQNCFFVVKSRVIGTMGKISYLAFQNKQDAFNFIKQYRGKIISFNKALILAKSFLKSDIKRVKKQKDKLDYIRGAKIYNQVCEKNKIISDDYLEINELKADIVLNHLCIPLKEKNLQAVSLYIWDLLRENELEDKEIEGQVITKEDEKCPVCGMFTYKYPRWAAQIFYEDGENKIHYSFDGVKDLMKFYFNSQKWGKYPIAKQKNIVKILVTDYYSQKGIDGRKAFYVIRSDIYGPMGNELIPFELEGDAQTFKNDHYGKRVIKFSDILEKEVYRLDSNE
jgi:nitrous oxide reductase accessory protein NosL